MRRIPYFAQVAGLFALYVVTAKVGLGLHSVGGVSTLLWAPTGIALAALVVLGYRVWPAITLAAFAVNVSAGAPLHAAAAIAVGNTLEAVLARWMLCRFGGFRASLERVQDVVALIFYAAILSTALAATVGTTALWWSDAMRGATYAEMWVTWWLGDMLSDLVVAPFLLVWFRATRVLFLQPKRRFEAIAVILLFTAATWTVYFFKLPPVFTLLPLPMVTFPFTIWAVLRFGQHGAVTFSFLISILAVFATARGIGPFAQEKFSFLYMEIYRLVAAVSVMIFAAAVTEREREKARAQEAVRIRDDFISIASHELKTPITSLKLQSELLERSIESEGKKGIDPKELHQHVKMSLRQIDSLASMIDDILNISKITSGKFSLQLEELDLSKLITRVVERHEPEIRKSNSKIELDVEPSLPGCWDRIRIEKVVANLLTNALKYGEGKPITIRANHHGRERIELTVQDRGVGISKADQARIFERFERIGSVTHYAGFGLGLYIVKLDLEAHGGTIRVDSVPGGGSQFTVELPLRCSKDDER